MQYYDVSVKGTLPVSDAFGVFAQVGGAYGSPGATVYKDCIGSSCIGLSQQAGWNALTAVGVQLNISSQLSLNLTNYYYYGANTPQGSSTVLLGGAKFNF